MLGSSEDRRCPRCESPNTVVAGDMGLPGYQKCVICGSRWQLRVAPGDTEPEARRAPPRRPEPKHHERD